MLFDPMSVNPALVQVCFTESKKALPYVHFSFGA